MERKDELGKMITDFESGKMDRRTFIKGATMMGLTLSSIGGFLSATALPFNEAWAQSEGKPVDVTVGFFPTWVGAWSGVVVKHLDLWKKHLPAGSKVDWDIQTAGPPMAANMMAGKTQIGYMGDTPGIVFEHETRDRRPPDGCYQHVLGYGSDVLRNVFEDRCSGLQERCGSRSVA